MGHARALLSISDPALQLRLYNQILTQGLSVRKVEELAKKYQNGEMPEEVPAKKPKTVNPYAEGISNNLTQTFNMPVNFTCSKSGKGSITFKFKNDEELMRLMSMFDKIKS